MELIIKKAVVLTGQGTDLILLTPDLESPYPGLNYDCVLKIDTQKNHGVEYCTKHFGIIPEVINKEV